MKMIGKFRIWLRKNRRNGPWTWLPAAGWMLLSACGAEPLPVPSPAVFSIRETSQAEIRTRSSLKAADIETRCTSVTLAGYTGGILTQTGYFTTAFDAMPLETASGLEYHIYALVNMGDIRASLPQEETGLKDLTYTIPGWESGPGSVQERGFPMAGSLVCIPGKSGGSTIPVTRLVAKISLQLVCRWDGASIRKIHIRNLNKTLVPFGTSRAESASDLLDGQEFYSGYGLEQGSYTFYAPENCQGIIDGIASAADKSPDKSPAIQSKIGLLTYLEAEVEASGEHSGRVLYRSCLGGNATTDCNLRRGYNYRWKITYEEDGLSENNWKIDTYEFDAPAYRYRIGLTPQRASLPVGGTQAYTIRRYGDLYIGNKMVEEDTKGTVISAQYLYWESSDSTVATVYNGTATGISPGMVTLTATFIPDPAEQATVALTVYSAAPGR